MGLVRGNNSLIWATALDNSGLQSGKLQAQNILSSLKTNISKTNVFGGLAVGAALVFKQIADNAHEFSKEFEQSMREVQTISVAATEDFDGMSASVIGISQDIPNSANELSKALYQIVSAGYDGADGLKLLESAGKAAVGGVTDVETAADGLTTVLNAWQISASKVDDVSDKLFKTVKLGKTTFGELSNNIATVAPVAASMGVSMDEVLAAVASLTKQGTPTGVALTQIRSALVSMNEVLGESWTQSMTLQEGLQAISDKAGGSQTELTNMMGRIEAVNAVLGLTGANAQTAAADLSEITNSAGAAGDAFEKMAQSEVNQSKLLSNNIQAALKPLGDTLGNMGTDIAAFLNKAFKSGGLLKGVLIELSSVSPFGRISKEAKLYSQALSEIADKTESEYNTAIASEVGELQRLFSALEKSNKGSNLRKELIDEINTKYKDYLPNMLSEKDNIYEIRDAYEAVNDELRKTIAYKFQNNAITEILNNQIQRETDEFADLSNSTGVSAQRFAEAFSDFYQYQKQLKTGIADVGEDIENLGDVTLSFGDMSMGTSKMQELSESLGINYDVLENNFKYLAKLRAQDEESIDKLKDKYGNYFSEIEKVAEKTNDISGSSGNNEKSTYLEQLRTELTKLEEKQQSYSDYLKNDLTEAEKANIETGKQAIECKKKLIEQIETELGLREKEKQETEETKQAMQGSIALLEKQLTTERELFEYSTTDEQRQQHAETIKQLEAQIAKYNELLNTREKQKKTETDLNKLSTKELAARLRNINKEIKKVKQLGGSYDDLAAQKTEVTKKLAEKASESLGNLSSAFSEIGSQVAESNEELGEALSSIGSYLNNAASIIQGIATGNYIQAIAGAASAMISAVQSLSGETASEAREKQLEKLNDLIDLQNKKLEYQIELLEEASGAEIYDNYYNAYKELDSSLDELNETLSYSISPNQDNGERRTGGTGYVNMIDTIDDFEELRDALLNNSDWFTEAETEYYQTLLDQYDELIEQQEEIKDSLYETLTGTTASAISDSILEGFADGQVAVADFADNFEDLMRQAILSTFQVKYLEEQFEDFYDMFGEAMYSDEGLSEEEIEQLREVFNENIETASAAYSELNDLFNEIFSTDLATDSDSQGLTGSIQASLTEETGTVLAGTLNSIRIDIRENMATMEEMNDKLAQIVDNTAYNSNLELLNDIKDLLKDQNARSVGL